MWLKLLDATLQTLAMSTVATIVAIVIGTPLAFFLITPAKKLSAHTLYKTMSLLLNAIRALPFIVLLIVLMPFTRFLVGTTLGWQAASIPLAIAAIPFFARLLEASLRELPTGLYEAGLAMGATRLQIYRHLFFPTILPGLCRAATTLMITLINYSAIAGTVGAGGLGALAYYHGFQRYDMELVFAVVIVLLILVEIIQYIGKRVCEYLPSSA